MNRLAENRITNYLDNTPAILQNKEYADGERVLLIYNLPLSFYPGLTQLIKKFQVPAEIEYCDEYTSRIVIKTKGA